MTRTRLRPRQRRRGSARALPLIAVTVLVVGVGTCTAGLFDKCCRKRPKRCPNECIEVPCSLPNNGYHATRWRRWEEPVEGSCCETNPPIPVGAPYAVPQGNPQFDPVPPPRQEFPGESIPQWQGGTSTPSDFGRPVPAPRWSDDSFDELPIEPRPAGPPSFGPATVPNVPAEPEPLAPTPLHAPGVGRYETHERQMDGARRTREIPRYSGIETHTRRLSHETAATSHRSSAGNETLELPTITVQYPTRQWSLRSAQRVEAETPDGTTIEKPVDAVLMPTSASPRTAVRPRPIPNRMPGQVGPVGRPGPTGYYRLISKPLGPQPPRTPAERIVR